MKLSKLKLKNFACFKEFECEFKGRVSRLIGTNGAGKTTIGLTAIWAGLKGIAEKNRDGQLLGERFRFIGKDGANAQVELTVWDEKSGHEVTVRNHISKTSNKITCEPVQSEDFLRDLLAVAFMSAKNFTALDARSQALLFHIDTTAFDKEITAIKEEYTFLNRELKSLGSPERVEEAGRIDVVQLLDAKTKVDKEMADRRFDMQTTASFNEDVEKTRATIAQEIGDTEERLEALRKRLSGVPAAKPIPEMPSAWQEESDRLREEIARADETNRKAAAYEQYQAKSRALMAKASEIEANRTRLKEVQDKRVAYIKEANLPLAGMEIDEGGGLLLTGRPIKEPHFSKGELELIVAKLHMAIDPSLKVRFVDDFEILDDENKAKIIDSLLGEGFQVITAELEGEGYSSEECIFLREKE